MILHITIMICKSFEWELIILFSNILFVLLSFGFLLDLIKMYTPMVNGHILISLRRCTTTQRSYHISFQSFELLTNFNIQILRDNEKLSWHLNQSSL